MALAKGSVAVSVESVSEGQACEIRVIASRPGAAFGSKTSIADPIKQFYLQGLAVGEYRIYSIETCENESEADPQSLRDLDDHGLKVEIADRDHHVLKLKPLPIVKH